MRRLFVVFVLTPAEQRLVIFVMLLLVAVAWSRHHRDLSFSAAPRPAEAATPAISSSPNEQ